MRAVREICNAVHLRNKETHLFGRSPDKEDYRGIKGSHKVNANSNSVPSSSVGGYARVLAQMAHICTRTFRCMCHNWALSEIHPMLQPLESRFLPPAHSFRFIACSFYLSCLYAVKIYSAILRRHHISILPPCLVLFSISSDIITTVIS